jgi:thioester reductase-like protein
MIFVTGFPGFIATRLLRRLLADDPDARIVALVEPRMAQRALEVADGIAPGRIEILPGDIGAPRLALTDADYDRVARGMTSAFHLAAVYDLAVPLEIAQRVNVDGTGNVLDLCAAAPSLERLNYVSTAYVAGLRTGVVYEHELALGQAFKNHYESTKFQAEVWVRDAMDAVPTTVYRPAIVVGDSRTGETQKFDGPYYLLRLVSLAKRRRQPIVQVGRSGAPFNVVPVDFVVDAMAAVSRESTAVGRTLHLVDPEPLTARELTDLLARAYADRGSSFSVPPRLVDAMLRSKVLRTQFGGTPRESLVYLNHPVRFDTRDASELLRRAGLTCPRFGDYAGPVVEFFRAHEHDIV